MAYGNYISTPIAARSTNIAGLSYKLQLAVRKIFSMAPILNNGNVH